MVATRSPLTCPGCRDPLGTSPLELAATTHCRACGAALKIHVLPALSRPTRSGRTAAERTDGAGAACYFHAGKQAEIPCDRCGRFLCALCHLDVGGQHLCPTCLGDGAGTDRPLILERERFRWDRLVWVLTLAPLATILFWFVTPVSALAGVGIGLWKLRSPPSRISRSRLSLIVGTIVAGSLAAAGVAGLVAMVVTAFGR